MTRLSGENMCVTLDGVDVVKDASISLDAGELVVVLGPNGAGKTTLLRALLSLVPLTSGSATLAGKDCAALSASARARKIAYLPQQRPLAWPNPVRDVVALGRFAHGATIGNLSPVDAQAVAQAVAACDLEHLIDRATDGLSGGELARVHIARALAAKAPLLLADEPMAALDPRHQIRVAQLLRQFADNNAGALVVLHDVALAARIASRLVWMKGGRIVADGTVEDTLNKQMMAAVYDVDAHIRFDEHGVDVRIQDGARLT